MWSPVPVSRSFLRKLFMWVLRKLSVQSGGVGGHLLQQQGLGDHLRGIGHEQAEDGVLGAGEAQLRFLHENLPGGVVQADGAPGQRNVPRRGGLPQGGAAGQQFPAVKGLGDVVRHLGQHQEHLAVHIGLGIQDDDGDTRTTFSAFKRLILGGRFPVCYRVAVRIRSA